MGRIRSILWVGSGDGLGCGVVADAPGADVAWVRDAAGALELPVEAFDAVVLDANDARQACEALRLMRRRALPPVLARLGAHEASQAPALRALGAAEVTLRQTVGESPTAATQLLTGIDRLLGGEAHSAPTDPSGAFRSSSPAIVGPSPQLRTLLALVRRAAATSATVLIHGETGTGKELFARALHRLGPRARRPFLAVNCAAFPEALLESELFGHARGSFTGADRDKQGLFEAASGGTLLLDEVGETSAALQAKLLRVLQEREVRPVGATRARRVDVRLVAATNRDLRREVEARRFRDDLYYRLAVFPIAVPPLRDRPADILPLARHFLARLAAREGKTRCTLAPGAEALLQAHAWPGNVRELENEIQRGLALVEDGQALSPDHFSERIRGSLAPLCAATPGHETLRQSLARIEAWLIRSALDAQGGRRAATARRLGITREGLYKKMQRLGIE